jgi:hypothetical protein
MAFKKVNMGNRMAPCKYCGRPCIGIMCDRALEDFKND